MTKLPKVDSTHTKKRAENARFKRGDNTHILKVSQPVDKFFLHSSPIDKNAGGHFLSDKISKLGNSDRSAFFLLF